MNHTFLQHNRALFARLARAAWCQPRASILGLAVVLMALAGSGGCPTESDLLNLPAILDGWQPDAGQGGPAQSLDEGAGQGAGIDTQVTADKSEPSAGAVGVAMSNGTPSETVGPKSDEALAERFAAVLAEADLEEEVAGSEAGEEGAPQVQGGDFVAGRLLVKFLPGGEKAGERLLGAAHVRVSGEIPQIGVKIIELPPQASERAHERAFRRWKEVEFAELDYICEPALIPNDPWYDDPVTPEWHLPMIDAPAAWNVSTGSNSVTIAVLDSGVDGGHPDLVLKMVPGWNILAGDSDTSDITGHGTLVAGQAAAASNNGSGVASVAWGCPLMPIVVSNSGGWATGSAIGAGLVWAADHGARVANVSFEMADSDTVTSAAEYLQSLGGIAVLSAGNSGTFDETPDNPFLLKVSATDPNDLVPSWSVTGNSIDLAAPGVAILTTLRGGGYASGTGTSASAPIVAGVAALVISVNPLLAGPEVQGIITQSADDLGPPGWDPEYGWGRVNAAQAVNLALNYGGYTDAEPPVVSIGSPANGSNVSGTITVQVSASDNVGVASVMLYVDETLLATDTSTPYAFSWDTTTASNGGHTLRAAATDISGNAAEATIGVTVDNTDTTQPAVAITSPPNGATVSATVSVQASASDNVGVASVTFKVDGVVRATDTAAPYAFAWDTTTVANGAHTLSATAVDAAGNTATATITVTVNNTPADTTPPAIAITAPSNGSSVGRTVTVTVNASDNVGVVRVELYVDGVKKDTATSPPFTTIWNAKKASPGAHTLQCRAYDAAGNVGYSATITVYK